MEPATADDEISYGGMVARFTKRIQPAVSALGDHVQVTIDIPDAPEWVTQLAHKDISYWELRVDAASRQYDYETAFPLPVYARVP